MTPPILIKKYGNRRLYDTSESRYITLDELSAKIRDGSEVSVVDAKSGRDLTQATLAQIIIEGRGAGRMLPIPLLVQLIRLGEDSLTEFFGRYMSEALAIYLQMKAGANTVARYNPFLAMPFNAGDTLARMWMGSSFASSGHADPPGAEWEGTDSEPVDGSAEPITSTGDANHSRELRRLRQELEELKRSIGRDANVEERPTERPASSQAHHDQDDLDTHQPANGDSEAPPAKRSRRKRRQDS